MVKKKQPYESPAITATRVELESSICAGSVDIQNPKGDTGEIQEQTVNTSFNSESGAFNSNGSWSTENP